MYYITCVLYVVCHFLASAALYMTDLGSLGFLEASGVERPESWFQLTLTEGGELLDAKSWFFLHAEDLY